MKNQTVALLALATLAGTTLAAPRESANAPATVDVPPDPATNSFTLSFTGADGGGSYQATRIRFDGTMTAVADFTYAYDTIMEIQPPTGAAVAYRMSLNYDAYTVETIARNLSLNGSFAPAGVWTFTVTDDYQDGDGGPESTLDNLVVTLDDQAMTAPSATSLGTLVDGTPVSAEAVVDPAGVKWFTLTNQEASLASGRSLTLTLINSASTEDSVLAVYTDGGAFVAYNDDFGDTTLSQLSFGAAGFDGDLPAGLHYVAVCTFPAELGDTGWDVTSTGDGGTFTLDVLQSAAPAGSWSETDDAGQDLGTAQTVTGSGSLPRIVGTLGANDVDMFKITICDPSSFSASTVGVTHIDTDTQLFLFDSSGHGVAVNDDSLTTAQSTLTSAFVTAAGTYYLAVTGYNIDPTDAGGALIWNNTPFATERAPDGPAAANALGGWTGTSATDGEAYAITLTGACHSSGGNACGAADLGGTGGVPGADNHLDNNDFVVFIDYFFNHNALADQGSIGGQPGADSIWDNNDFVVFIDNFFNAPASCR